MLTGLVEVERVRGRTSLLESISLCPYVVARDLRTIEFRCRCKLASFGSNIQESLRKAVQQGFKEGKVEQLTGCGTS